MVKAAAFREDGSIHGEIVTIPAEFGGRESARHLCRLGLLSTPAIDHCEVWEDDGTGVEIWRRYPDGIGRHDTQGERIPDDAPTEMMQRPEMWTDANDDDGYYPPDNGPWARGYNTDYGGAFPNED